ncbi:MAG TPA: hypothetical protein VHP31_05460 [Caproicibacter sp.]|nr:hypothetical protein [Caproicibacter sp.]
MNGRKKLLCVFLLVLFLFSYASMSVFAVTDPASGSGTSTSKPAETSSPAVTSSPSTSTSQPESKQSTVPAQASAAPSAAPSKSASSSPASSRRPRRYYSSSTASSEVNSNIPSEVSSVPESGTISLPNVDSIAENDPLNSVGGNTTQSDKMKMIGILSWACIALGVIVVLIVVLSNRRPPRGPGRKRYRRPKRTGKKRLLNDKYYRGLNRY